MPDTQLCPYSFSSDGNCFIYNFWQVLRIPRESVFIIAEDKPRFLVEEAGDTKRIKRNRSRDTFKMRLGMGTVLEQSGDGLVEKASGSSLCRISLWQYVLTGVETGRLPENELTGELINFARCYQAKEIFYNSLQIARVKLVRKLKSLV